MARIGIRKRGYIFVSLALSMLVLLGVTGLAVDLGRMYIVRNEAQSFVDSMALSATTNLNGDKAGVNAAAAAVQNGVASMRWDMGLNPFVWGPGQTEVTFSSSTAPGTWTNAASVPVGPAVAGGPPQPVSTDRVRVTTSVSLPMYFMEVATGATAATIAASATAIRSGVSSLPANANVIPLSAISHKAINTQIDDDQDPFGLRIGQYYTLRWDKNNKTQCPGDGAGVVAWAQGDNMSDWLGPVCQGASTCKDALDNNGLNIAVSTGPTQFDTKEGTAESISHAADARADGDTDPANTGSQSYFGASGYSARGTGNGRRVVWAPMNNGVVTGTGAGSSSTLVGFGAFLMMDSNYTGTGGANAICGQYLGSMIPGFPFSGGVSPGNNPTVGNAAMAVRLVQ